MMKSARLPTLISDLAECCSLKSTATSSGEAAEPLRRLAWNTSVVHSTGSPSAACTSAIVTAVSAPPTATRWRLCLLPLALSALIVADGSAGAADDPSNIVNSDYNHYLHVPVNVLEHFYYLYKCRVLYGVEVERIVYLWRRGAQCCGGRSRCTR